MPTPTRPDSRRARDPSTVLGDGSMWLGRGLAPVGDWGGDGFDDVLMSRLGSSCEAGAQLHLGSASGLDPAPAASVIDPACTVVSGATIGGFVTSGDLDGNGVPDLVVGGPINLLVFDLY